MVTTRVVEFNDAAALERELAHGDVAAVLMEPALTNIGIVLPREGYLAQVRELTRQAGTLLINDETHTFSAGPGGCTRAWGLEPDIVTIGKSIGGGVPCGAYGLDAEPGGADPRRRQRRPRGHRRGGRHPGGQRAVCRRDARLPGSVLTDAAFAAMTAVATRYTEAVRAALTAQSCPGRSPSWARGRSTASPPAAGQRRRVGGRGR